MAFLAKEYTDVKGIKHKVEHIILPTGDKNSKEQIIEEILCILKREGRHIIE